MIALCDTEFIDEDSRVLDNMNDYDDVRIKEARLAELQKFENYTFIKGNLFLLYTSRCV